MKRTPIVKRHPYSTSRIGAHTVFLLEHGQRPPDERIVAPGDYYVTYDGYVFVRTHAWSWRTLHEDTIEREKVLRAWRLKNDPPPTHLQF